MEGRAALVPALPRAGKRVDMGDLSFPDLGDGGDDLGIIGAILLAIVAVIAAIVSWRSCCSTWS